MVARDYVGYTDATEPSGGFVLPATTSVIVVVKVQDSALRPPQFVAGAHGSFSVVDGACAPAYMEAWLSPLGAYALLRARGEMGLAAAGQERRRRADRGPGT